jgi:hypothetical protein
LKKSETIESTKNTPWGISLVRVALRVGSLALAYWALSHFAHGRYGKGLVDAAVALLYALTASGDLGHLWASRHTDAMALVRAERPTVKFLAGGLLFYILFISGVIVQCFFE